MEHFDIVQWADFVRGLPESADRTAMEEHLSSGCQACGGAVRQLRKLVAVADAEARYKVPSYAVDYAKSIYPLQQPAKAQARGVPREDQQPSVQTACNRAVLWSEVERSLVRGLPARRSGIRRFLSPLPGRRPEV